MRCIRVGDHAYRIIMSVYRRYRRFYKTIDDFLVDAIDHLLMSDPSYMAELIDWLTKKSKGKVKVVVAPVLEPLEPIAPPASDGDECNDSSLDLD